MSNIIQINSIFLKVRRGKGLFPPRRSPFAARGTEPPAFPARAGNVAFWYKTPAACA